MIPEEKDLLSDPVSRSLLRANSRDQYMQKIITYSFDVLA